jgi:hypothetical protein
MSFEQGGQTGEPLGRCVAADAPVDYAPPGALGKQLGPGLPWFEPVAGGNTVSQDENDRPGRQAIGLVPGTGREAGQYQHREEQKVKAPRPAQSDASERP